MDNVDIRASRSIENVTVRGSRVSLLALRCCPHKLIVFLLKIAWPREKVEEQQGNACRLNLVFFFSFLISHNFIKTLTQTVDNLSIAEAARNTNGVILICKS